LSKTWYGDYQCPRCGCTFQPTKSNQIYCNSKCRELSYYESISINKPKKRMTKMLKKELSSYITFVLNPKTNGESYQEVWNYFKDKGLVNENSLKLNLIKNGFKIVDNIVLKETKGI
jgi:hypothetical protein